MIKGLIFHEKSQETPTKIKHCGAGIDYPCPRK